MKFQFLHFHLSEVEKLVYQIKQPLCITMNQVQLFLLIFIMRVLNNSIQWRNDQAEWCSEFMAYVGEEFCF